MDFSYLISEFVDGSLDKPGEENLFNELSTNEELRSELRQQIMMEKAFNKKLSAFVPSAASTIGVFSKLGFVAPLAGAAIATGTAIKSGFFSTYLQGIISAVTATVLTTATFLTLTYSGVFEKKADTGLSQKPNSQSAQPAQITQPAVSPDNSQFSNNLANKQEIQVPKVIEKIKYVYITKETDPVVSSIADQKVEPTIIDKKIDETKQQTNSIAELNPETKPLISESRNINPIQTPKINSPSSDFSNSRNMDFAQPIKFELPSSMGLSFGVSGMTDWQMNQSMIEEPAMPKVGNIAISGEYKISENFSIGGEFRKERFYQSFSGYDKFKNEYKYNAFEDYPSGVITLKYDMIKSTYFSIYSQAAIGGTITGIIGRLSSGVELFHNSLISPYIGIEASNLFYTHDNIWFNSPKIGMNYGLHIKF
ncbi:MAG: hypothetical protein NT007_02640 [Candidatus Kapabacteria bacterium]|nr:hypothetical protein [Candidatus Kapabacteria bacterium]